MLPQSWAVYARSARDGPLIRIGFVFRSSGRCRLWPKKGGVVQEARRFAPLRVDMRRATRTLHLPLAVKHDRFHVFSPMRPRVPPCACCRIPSLHLRRKQFRCRKCCGMVACHEAHGTTLWCKRFTRNSSEGSPGSKKRESSCTRRTTTCRSSSCRTLICRLGERNVARLRSREAIEEAPTTALNCWM